MHYQRQLLFASASIFISLFIQASNASSNSHAGAFGQDSSSRLNSLAPRAHKNSTERKQTISFHKEGVLVGKSGSSGDENREDVAHCSEDSISIKSDSDAGKPQTPKPTSSGVSINSTSHCHVKNFQCKVATTLASSKKYTSDYDVFNFEPSVDTCYSIDEVYNPVDSAGPAESDESSDYSEQMNDPTYNRHVEFVSAFSKGSKVNQVRMLDDGSFGPIFQAKVNNVAVVIKKIPKCQVEHLIQVVYEIAVMRSMNQSEMSPKLLAYCMDKRAIYIFMEACMYGNLHSAIMSAKQPLSLGIVQQLLQQVLKALLFMHKANIVHADLKAENVFINKEGNLKLADFGYSIMGQNPDLVDGGPVKPVTGKVICGTPVYSAPEILGGMEYGTAADIWSVGVLCYFMLTKQFPYGKHSTNEEKELLEEIGQKHMKLILKKLPDSIQVSSFIQVALTHDMSKRPCVEQLLESDFIQINDSKSAKSYQKQWGRVYLKNKVKLGKPSNLDGNQADRKVSSFDENFVHLLKHLTGESIPKCFWKESDSESDEDFTQSGEKSFSDAF